MKSKKRGMYFTLRRVKNFMKELLRSKRAALGIGIIVIFSIIAAAAPIVTPNDPVYGYYVAADYARPQWFRYFPGGENLVENLQIIEDPEFNSRSSVYQWNFTSEKTPEDAGKISFRYNPVIGNGSIMIRYVRFNPFTPLGSIQIRLYKTFEYRYGPPPRFSCSISILTQGADKVPLNLQLIIRPVQNETPGYPPFWSVSISNDTAKWIKPSPLLDSYETEFKKRFGSRLSNPASIVFSEPGTYVYEITIQLYDKEEEPVDLRIYLDDIHLKIYGNAYGLLGTDHMGRDIFAQLVYGARISLVVGLLAAILSVVIGLIVGLVAGYLGGIIDEVLMRFTDALLVIPTLPLYIVLIAVIGPSLWNLILIIGMLGWMGFARQVRSVTLSLKERPFVEASRAAGASTSHIIFKHITPNVMTLVYVSLALSVPSAIISEAALSWLGLFDPSVMSWGKMLYYAQWNQGTRLWWWVLPPGLCIAALSLSFILLGYALDEILNPRLRLRK